MSTWMVVEDEPDIYDVLLAMFEIWGIEGVAFVDGAEAVSWIETVDQGRVHGELPELAILDIRLPEISGTEVGARLRKSTVLGDIAIVLITAYRLSPEEEKSVVAQAKADLLMYKPLPAMAELREAMDGVIAKHHQRKTQAVAGAAVVEETPEVVVPQMVPPEPVSAALPDQPPPPPDTSTQPSPPGVKTGPPSSPTQPPANSPGHVRKPS
ncbi:MAG: response regulator transcription factor [Anaerolineae bacterium]|nr:response regulator transcription factor [Anaerolineae bacterium]